MEIGEQIKLAREARGLSQRELGKIVGVSQPAIKKIESGQTKKSRYIPELTRALGLDSGEVPLVGYVGAGGEAHLFGEGQGPFDMVAGPRAERSPNTVAVKIDGDSLGPIFNGWIIYYDRLQRPVTTNLLGSLCVVGLTDGRVLVKQLKRARASGLYHLVSNYGPDIVDVAVEWAARVIDIKPR